MKTLRVLGIAIAGSLLAAACSEIPVAGDRDGEDVIVAGPGSGAELDSELVKKYFVALEDHPAGRTITPQLALRSISLGVKSLSNSVPELKSCADPEVHPLLDEFVSLLPVPPDLRLGDVEFVTDYGYGIGLLSYYDLALQAANEEFGETTAEDVYEACDLSSLRDENIDAELASIDSVLKSESVLHVLVALQPELERWRVCLGEAGVPVEGMPFIGLEDLDMVARHAFDQLATQYFEVFVSLIDQGLTYRELLDGNIDPSSGPEAVAALEHLQRIHAEEVSMAFLDQRCFDEHVSAAYGETQVAELQRLQRDWPNL